MAARNGFVLLSLLLIWASGCDHLWHEVWHGKPPDNRLGQGSSTALVQADPFDGPRASPLVQTAYTHLATENASRVSAIGAKLIAANPQLGIRPTFVTVGWSQPSVTHKETSHIVISEGLVKQCQSDGQLAAVLAMEIGKIITEREAGRNPLQADAQRPVPYELRVGTDSDNGFTGANLIRQAELARYEKQRLAEASTRSNPEVVARNVLTKAGYPLTDLDSVLLLQNSAQKPGSTQPLAAPSWQAPAR